MADDNAFRRLMSSMLADWRADRRTVMKDIWRAAAPCIVLAAGVLALVLVGLGLARAGFGGLALVVLGGGVFLVILGQARALGDFILSASGVLIWRRGFYILVAAASWSRCPSSLFRTRALRATTPPPRFAPAI